MFQGYDNPAMHSWPADGDYQVGHFLAEIVGGDEVRFLKLSPGFERVMGTRPPERVHLAQLHSAGGRIEEGLARLRDGEPLVFRVRYNHRRLLFSIFPIGGDPLTVTGTLMDATEAYWQDLLMRSAERLREATASEVVPFLLELLSRELEGLRAEAVEGRRFQAAGVREKDGAVLVPLGEGQALRLTGRALTASERSFLERLSRLATLAADRNRALAESRRRQEAYYQLLSMANTLEATADPRRILELTLEFLLGLTRMDAAVFARIEGRRLRPELVAGALGREILRNYERLRPPVLRQAVKRAFAERRVVADFASDPVSIERLSVHSVVVAPLWVSGRPYGAIELLASKGGGLSDEERDIFVLAVRRLGRMLERAEYLRELDRTREAILRSFGRILEHRDLETRGHTDRVVRTSEFLGRKLGFRGERLRALRWGAYLHDIGKLAIPDTVLLKPSSLETHEWQVMRSHPELAVSMLEPLGFLPEITLNVVRYHHERWDGSGYPLGLKGEKIPLEARIFAVADVFDALLSRRPYKEAWPLSRAVEELRRLAGRELDPRVVELFLASLQVGELPLSARIAS